MQSGAPADDVHHLEVMQVCRRKAAGDQMGTELFRENLGKSNTYMILERQGKNYFCRQSHKSEQKITYFRDLDQKTV